MYIGTRNMYIVSLLALLYKYNLGVPARRSRVQKTAHAFILAR